MKTKRKNRIKQAVRARGQAIRQNNIFARALARGFEIFHGGKLHRFCASVGFEGGRRAARRFRRGGSFCGRRSLRKL